MKTIICDNKEHFLLTKEEYDKMVAKPKHTLAGIPVNVYIPLPEQTCSNWEYDCNWAENTGVIYKGQQVTVQQLKWLRDLLTNKRPFVDIDVDFDGLPVDIQEVNKIIETVESNKTGSGCSTFKRESKVIV